MVGAGELGALLASRMPGVFRKVIINRPKTEAVALADEVGGVASDQFSAVRGCDVIFCAVPDEDVLRVIGEMAPHLEPGALVVNMALTVMTSELSSAFPNLRIAAVKVVGDAAEMARGGQGAVLIDHASDEEEELLRQLVEGLGPAVRGSEQMALDAAAAVVGVVSQAAAELRRRLKALGLAEPQITSAVAAAGPGVFRAVAQKSFSPFIQSVLARMQGG